MAIAADLLVGHSVAAAAAPIERITFDLYRDVHKGIRAETFGVVLMAGSTDPTDDAQVSGVVERLRRLLHLLEDHAEHEEAYLGPIVQRQMPDMAERIVQEHRVVESSMATLRELGAVTLASGSGQRRLAMHRMYLACAGFTASYLTHMATEELEVMPGLAATVPVEELIAVSSELVAAIEPADLDAYLRAMLPAQHALDRAEMLAGMAADAPPQALAAVLALAEEVLTPSDHRRLVADLDDQR